MSGGNPFYGLELARALGNTESAHDPTRPLPVPERLEELLSARLGSFTGPTRDALVLAAAHARVTTDELRAAGADPDALEPALDERVVELTAGAVRFTHPLLASTLYQGLAPTEQRRAHRRLARVVRGSVARARHLALSTDRPAATLAATLEQEAAAAARQGTPVVAAELGEHALRLTPPDDGAGRDRRAAATARAHIAAGTTARARILATELVERSTPGLARAEALQLLADAEGDDIRRGITLRREALVEAEGHPALQAALHAQLALAVRFVEGLEAAERHAAAAVALAEPLGDDALRAAALAGLALIRFNAGRPDAVARAEEAYALASEEDGVVERSGGGLSTRPRTRLVRRARSRPRGAAPAARDLEGTG